MRLEELVYVCMHFSAWLYDRVIRGEQESASVLRCPKVCICCKNSARMLNWATYIAPVTIKKLWLNYGHHATVTKNQRYWAKNSDFSLMSPWSPLLSRKTVYKLKKHRNRKKQYKENNRDLGWPKWPDVQTVVIIPAGRRSFYFNSTDQ